MSIVIAPTNGTAVDTAAPVDTRPIHAWAAYTVELTVWAAHRFADVANDLEARKATRYALPYFAAAATIIGAAVIGVNL